jgi:glycosyltransferase involved in cell wall biosynthesis
MNNIIKNPLVSVIINCYNGEKYLSEALESVLNQSYENLEIIFWDNQSTDSSKSIVESANDARIKYFYAKNFTKLYEARDFAIKESTGSYLTFLDVDDWWDKDKISTQLAFFSDGEFGLVCSNFKIYNQFTKKSTLAHRKRMESGFVIAPLLKYYYVGLLTIMIKREAYISAGNYCDKNFHIIGDFDLVMRLCRNHKLKYIDNSLATYRSHLDSESKKYLYMQSQELRTWYQQFIGDEIFSKQMNMSRLLYFSYYLEALSHILNKERFKALKFIFKTSMKNSVKIIVLCAMPLSLINAIRK